MGSLFSALGSASNALEAFQRAIDVTQDNVTNANSPGYAKQIPIFQSTPFQLSSDLSGGIVEQTQDGRNQYADAVVRQQLSLQGAAQQLQSSLAPLQNVFDVSSSSPIPSALNQLFQSFSQWSTQPSNPVYQTAVINAAQQAATAFQQAAAQLSGIRGNTIQDLQSTVGQINHDLAQVQAYNVQLAHQNGPNPGAQANLEAALEDLSSQANVQILSGVGGTVTVLLGGQTPLVIGTQLNTLQVQNDATNSLNGPPNQAIVDSNGNDVTSQITSGSLSGLLNVVNTVLPSLAGGGNQVGGLNTLAQGLADSVNNLLAQGSTTSTPPYQTGLPLFTYTPGSPTGVASSISVNSALTPSQLAPTNPGPPVVSNGIALQLAGLDTAPGGQINGMGFTQYFGSLTSQVGNAVSNATTSAAAQTQMVAQAKSLQQQASGVNLDEEAIRLVQLQSSYQAASKVVTVIDQLTQTLMNMVQ
ncbi:MAG TPA: flagellar hook-associated protein FlgK [Bryobacteraceae bacterium]|nr:flagellar hook-associated protein FlgK [Bryobacteraceae bacterium]